MRQRKLLAVTALLGFGLIVYHADRGTLPGWVQMAFVYPNADKLGHVGVAALLAFALHLGCNGRSLLMDQRRIPVGSFLTLLLMTVEEFSQILFSRRNFEWVDLVCDILGICIASSLIWIISASGRGRRVDEGSTVGFGRGSGE